LRQHGQAANSREEKTGIGNPPKTANQRKEGPKPQINANRRKEVGPKPQINANRRKEVATKPQINANGRKEISKPGPTLPSEVAIGLAFQPKCIGYRVFETGLPRNQPQQGAGF